jgi:hypothetical protein
MTICRQEGVRRHHHHQLAAGVDPQTAVVSRVQLDDWYDSHVVASVEVAVMVAFCVTKSRSSFSR